MLTVSNTHNLDLARAKLSKWVFQQAEALKRKYGLTYEESDDAPETYEGVAAAFSASLNNTGIPILVRKSDSDSTIYLAEFHNWAFRFWHDFVHFWLKADFSLSGEAKVAESQIYLCQEEFGKDSLEAKLFAADELGQLAYFHIHNEHVANQYKFCVAMAIDMKDRTQ